MQETRLRIAPTCWAACALAIACAIGCADEGVGEPCVPETVPCNAAGEKCGYKDNEAYIETSSVQCRSRICIVYKLANGTNGEIPSDPRVRCTGTKGNSAGCVDDAALETSVYCTRRCTHDGSCPAGFTCEPVLSTGNEGVIGSYCIKPGALDVE